MQRICELFESMATKYIRKHTIVMTIRVRAPCPIDVLLFFFFCHFVKMVQCFLTSNCNRFLGQLFILDSCIQEVIACGDWRHFLLWLLVTYFARGEDEKIDRLNLGRQIDHFGLFYLFYFQIGLHCC